MGRITAIDTVNLTVTVENELANSYVTSPPTYIKLNVFSVKNFSIDKTENVGFGNKGFRGKTIPAGTILRVRYVNNDGVAKTWNWKAQYYITG